MRSLLVLLGTVLATPAVDDRCVRDVLMVETPEGPVATCRVGTQGPLVVFESGLGDGMTAWRDVIDSVSRFARVLAYDRPGIGASPPATGMGDPMRAVDRLADLIARIGEREPVVIVGHSLGGVLAQIFARRYPEQMSGMVLVDPTPGGFFDSLRVITGDAQFQESQRRREASLGGAALEEWKHLTVALRSADSTMALEGRPVRILSAGHIENPDTSIGPRAKAIWLRLQARMAARLGGTQQTVPDAGHYIQRSRPHAVIDAIRAALAPPSRD